MPPPMERHGHLLCAYKKAEDLLHSLGIETGEGIDTTAINELRYAGRHVLNGLNTTDEHEWDREYRRAEDHCERALYEAYDNAIFFCFRSFDKFKGDYSRIPITDTIPDFIDIEEAMLNAKKFLEKARKESEKREDYYEQAMEQHQIVAKAWCRLEASRSELNKAVMSFNESMQKEAEARKAAARASAEAASGRNLMIRMGWIVGVTTVAVNLAMGLLRVYVSG